MAAVVRTIKHGVLKIKDSASTAITVGIMSGGLSCQLKNQPSQVIRNRGTLDQWILVDSEPLDFSFDLQVDMIVGPDSGTAAFSSLTVAEALGITHNNGVLVLSATSDSPAGEPTTFNLELTITNPGTAPATEVLTFNECIVDVITLEEGYPTMMKISGKALSLVTTTT